MRKSLYKNIIKKAVLIFTILNFPPNSAFAQKNKDTKKVRKPCLAILMLIGGLLISPVLATVAVGTPPENPVAIGAKPEVWGYDLRDRPSIPPGYSHTGLPYHAPDGDIVFKIRRCVENCNDLRKAKYEYAMLWFLAGKVEYPEDTTVYVEQHQLKSDYQNRVELPNGECIKTFHRSTGKLCQVNDLAHDFLIKGKCIILDDDKNINEYDIVTNRNPEIERYSILGAMNNIYRYIDQPDGLCDRGGPGGGELIYQQLYPMRSIIGLKDGTFITASSDLLIRFDSNLKTKFTARHDVDLAFEKVIKGNFFVLSYEKIKELDDKVAINNDHGVQGLHDELLLYLYRREEIK